MAATIRIIVETSGGVDAVKKDLSSLGDTAKSAGGGFSSLKEIATGALREVGAMAVNALGQAASAVGGFLKDSISVAGDFQSGMLEFQAVAGKSVDTTGLQQFHDLFISLGKELPVSTADVQKAAIELVKGGIDPATVAAGGLEQSIKFAAAAMGGDLAAAAEVSAKVVGGWADVGATAAQKADLLTHATDLLTKAANASTVDVHDLSLGLYNVQGTAKSAGLSLDETTTALAELAPRFANANTAGTSFRNFLTRIQPSTQPAQDAMEALGLYTEKTGSVFFDAQGKFVGVAKASELLQNATKGLTNAQKLQALQQIFGNDAMNAASAFAEMGAQGYNDMTAALNNANGVSDNAALKQQGLNTAMENFKGSIEALQITVGEALLPVLTDLFNNVLAPAVNTVTDFATAIFGADDPIYALVQSVDALVPGMGSLIGYFASVATEGDYLNDFLTGIPEPLQGFISAIGMLVTSIDPLIQYFQSVNEDGDYLNDWLTHLPEPMQAVVASIGRLVVGFQEGSGAFGAIQATALTVFGTLSTYIPAVMTAIGAFVRSVTAQMSAFWQAHGAEIVAFAKAAWDVISDIYNTSLKVILSIVIGTFQGIAEFIKNHGAAIQTILGGAWQMIASIVMAALNLIQGLLHAALAIMQGDWQGAWAALQNMALSFSANIANAVIGFLNLIAGFFGTSLEGIKATWQGAWDGLKAIVSNINWADVGNYVIDGIISGLSGASSRLADAARRAANDALNAAKSALGISSPSKVFAAQVGLPMAQGMAMGLTSGAPMVAQAGGYAASAAVAGATTNNYTLNFAPNYSGQPSERMDYRFAKSLAGIA